jgi:DNA-binding transcriptional MocR family regulator
MSASDLGTARIEQHALTNFLNRGEIDRHLRRMGTRYRRRREALISALGEPPEAEIQGIAAGLHAAIRLRDTDNEQAILNEARRRHIELGSLAAYRVAAAGPPTLLLGHAPNPRPTIRAGITEIAKRSAQLGHQIGDERRVGRASPTLPARHLRGGRPPAGSTEAEFSVGAANWIVQWLILALPC